MIFEKGSSYLLCSLTGPDRQSKIEHVQTLVFEANVYAKSVVGPVMASDCNLLWLERMQG
jgi:hypothetical protein